MVLLRLPTGVQVHKRYGTALNRGDRRLRIGREGRDPVGWDVKVLWCSVVSWVPLCPLGDLCGYNPESFGKLPSGASFGGSEIQCSNLNELAREGS